MAERHKAAVAEKFKDAIARGPSAFEADDDWTEALVQSWAPPECKVFRDPFNGRWRFTWKIGKGQLSRAWGQWGYKHSALLCLRESWRDFTHHRYVQCPIPGIFEISAEAGA